MSTSVQSLTHAELRAEVAEKSHELSKLIGEVYARRTDAELASVSRSFYDLIDSANNTIDTFHTPIADNIVDSTNEYVEDTSGLLEAFDNIPTAPGEGIDSDLLPAQSEPTFPDTLTVAEVAEMFGVTGASIRSLIKTGRLKTKGKIKQGRPTKITQASFTREYKRRQKAGKL